jgi:hypothetical protein
MHPNKIKFKKKIFKGIYVGVMVPTLPMLHPCFFAPLGNGLPSIFLVHCFSLLTTYLMEYFVNPLSYKREKMWKNEMDPT